MGKGQDRWARRPGQWGCRRPGCIGSPPDRWREAAAKTLEKFGRYSGDLSLIRNEVKAMATILEKVDHENIVKLLNVFDDARCVPLLQELCRVLQRSLARPTTSRLAAPSSSGAPSRGRAPAGREGGARGRGRRGVRRRPQGATRRRGAGGARWRRVFLGGEGGGAPCG